MRLPTFPTSPGLFVYSVLISVSATWLSGCLRSSEPVPTGPIAQVNAGFPSAKTLNAKLGRGINVGNALDAPKEGEWGAALHH